MPKRIALFNQTGYPDNLTFNGFITVKYSFCGVAEQELIFTELRELRLRTYIRAYHQLSQITIAAK